MFANTSPQSFQNNPAELNSGRDLDSLMTKSQSSLQATRDAIARWTKGPVSPVRATGQKHVSVQQRWVAQAQRDLSAWMREGGFAQRCDPASAAPAAATGMLAPQLYKLPGLVRSGMTQESADVCLD